MSAVERSVAEPFATTRRTRSLAVLARFVLRLSRRWVSLALATLCIAGCASPGSRSDATHDAAAPATSTQRMRTAEEHELDLASFDKVWTTVRDKHWDPDLGGLDWEAVRERYWPRAQEARTMQDVRTVLREMVGELGASHFGIVPSEAYRGADDSSAEAGSTGESEDEEGEPEGRDGEGRAGEGRDDDATTDAGRVAEGNDAAAEDGAAPDEDGVFQDMTSEKGEAGVIVRILDGKATVTDVWREWPAWEAGVRPGFEILSIGKWKVNEAIKMAGEEADGLFFMMIEGALSADRGKTVRVEFLDGKDQKITIEVPSGPERGEGAAFGNMPAVPIWVDKKRVGDGDIGYVAFNMFLNPVKLMPEVESAVTEFADARGFIIDLRGNPGGLGGLAMGIAGWFVTEKNLYLGVMKTRTNELKFIVNPRQPHFDGPLAIIVDGGSASTSEIFAGGLQDLGRARVFGTTSAGAALPSVIEALPNGDRFQWATANYISKGGNVLEGVGVTPDEVIVPSREELLQGRDPVLEAAVTWIAAGAPGRP